MRSRSPDRGVYRKDYDDRDREDDRDRNDRDRGRDRERERERPRERERMRGGDSEERYDRSRRDDDRRRTRRTPSPANGYSRRVDDDRDGRRPARRDESEERRGGDSRGMPRSSNPYKVYVGGLPQDLDEEEFREFFRSSGKIVAVQLKGRFGFVEFAHKEDAKDCIRDKDGTHAFGSRIIVRPHGTDHFANQNSPYFTGDRGTRREAGRGPPAGQVVPPSSTADLKRRDNDEAKTKHRILVQNLDERVSWQDLKDFGRNVATVNYANVFMRDGRKMGVIEYLERRDVEKALDALQGRTLYSEAVRVEEDFGQYERGGSRQSYGRAQFSRPDEDDEQLRREAKMARRDERRSRSRGRRSRSPDERR